MKVDALERQIIANDVIITGIPASREENVETIFDSICKAVGYTVTSYVNVVNAVFRLPGKSDRRPIIVKFTSWKTKIDFIKQYRSFKNLLLSHIGFLSSSPIYISECLTKYNREIFKAAAIKRKKGDIFNVFTIRGHVFIKKVADGNPIKLLAMDDVSNIGH